MCKGEKKKTHFEVEKALLDAERVRDSETSMCGIQKGHYTLVSADHHTFVFAKSTVSPACSGPGCKHELWSF